MDSKRYAGQLVFGLDIGTRSVVGTVGYKSGNQFVVIAHRVKEHDTRSMLDGQIHDIHRVGETIADVKAQLEEVVGRPLSEVCIAAAGRVLRTVTTHVEYPFTGDQEVRQEDIYGLISAGIEKAYQEFIERNEEDDFKFYCVGYSVVRYYLNGYLMGNLEGHKARTIGLDLIATFLPDDVVDGLYKAVEIAGLSVSSLTLEPIAAIQLAIPERFRMLNIALLDVGAGTSDISITNDGCILAYGMIPIAGDVLTEVIARHCLVDFATAEQIKRDAGEMEMISYMDVMLLPQTVSSKEIKEVTAPIIDDMAEQAAEKIKELNGDKAVSAVFVVGGGGKMPGYTEAVAEKLGIAKERVALRGEEVMQQIVFEEDVKKDSVLVTPIGICLNFYEQSNNFIFVSFNGNRIKIYDNNRLSVGDAALQVQFPNDGLFPKRGKALNFTVNGKQRMARGQLGEAAIITVNGEAADIHTPIHANDVIKVVESTAGEEGRLMLGTLAETSESLTIYVNEKKIIVPRFASVNGSLQSNYYEIQEDDEIVILNYYTVGQIIEFMDVVLDPNMNLYVNNKLADRDTPVYENFSVLWTLETLPNAIDLWQEGKTGDMDLGDEEDTGENGDGYQSDAAGDGSEVKLLPEKQEITLELMVNGKPVALSGKDEYIYVDVFEAIDFDLTRPRGKSIVTTLNGRSAQYMEPLHSGDVLEVYWKS
ncbi:cell division protein FtsA [Parablautia intestinalis]|jgi:cell division ATPase FtsA|uniref:cell division protein FtsA n=1 Tax=Parablautia intestinalis TaxID=2320100 RepID=UPI00256EF85E|nr:cell division protein FtsA [Parablautia intestinalis]MCI8616286.1 cell division protein FtsA [Lachnospiraceae bacterium]